MLIKISDLESERKVLSMWAKKSNKKNSCQLTFKNITAWKRRKIWITRCEKSNFTQYSRRPENRRYL